MSSHRAAPSRCDDTHDSPNTNHEIQVEEGHSPSSSGPRSGATSSTGFRYVFRCARATDSPAPLALTTAECLQPSLFPNHYCTAAPHTRMKPHTRRIGRIRAPTRPTVVPKRDPAARATNHHHPNPHTLNLEGWVSLVFLSVGGRDGAGCGARMEGRAGAPLWGVLGIPQWGMVSA